MVKDQIIKEIRDALENTIMILDSGYFSDENLEAAYENNIKCFNKCQGLLQDVLMINFVERNLMISIIIFRRGYKRK